VKPVAGYQTSGAIGAVRGAGVGVLGLFAKPLSSFSDILTRGMQAITYMVSLEHDAVLRALLCL
jgi:hypothetical protein